MAMLPAKVRGLLLDLDGTVYLGDRLLPGAARFVERARARGVRLLFLSNNSSRSCAAYREKLRRLGLPVEASEVFTSTSAALVHLGRRHPGARVCALGTPEFEEELRAGGVRLVEDEPEVVLLGFDKTLTYEKIVRAYRALSAGAVYLATHPDVLCPTDEGFLPDVGCFLALFETATGRRPRVLGKPSEDMVRCALDLLGLEPGAVAMVGDRLYTDVRMANRAGLLSVLVLSGETREEDLGGAADRPDLVAEHLGDLSFEAGPRDAE